MIKEIKYFTFIVVIIIFLIFTLKYYFSDTNIKNSYRALNNINKKIELYLNDIPNLKSDTENIIEYINETNTKKKKKYSFWNLLNKDD
tara:strand:+ start:292 stop:555 length:264 start_codon:yes stop_codon:yes gene_type:complete